MVDVQMPRCAGLVPGMAGTPLAEELTDGQLLQQFVHHRNERAFTTLVHRYGPLVLGVCRRLLRHAQDAEDAFQATFLVLVRRAASLKRPELLANWLYGVAYRTALHARTRAARRSQREKEAAQMRPDPPRLAQELSQLIDHELARLPEKYRAPLVLCYLEGKTNAEAARLLGWPAGSMCSRLARARELLRERLSSAHRALPLVLPGFFITDQLESVTPPPVLIHATVQAALGLAAGGGIASGVVSAAVKELMEATLWSLGTSRRRWLLVILLCLILLSGLASTVSAAVQQTASSTAAATGSCKH